MLGIGRPALAILILFLFAAIGLAWALARTLTRLHTRVAEEAVTDPLTGLWNRRYMAEMLDREVARALRFGHPISLIILDVDDFKQINDRQGHVVGDMVLERVADVIREATRSIDVAARYGGDELALILVETGREGSLIVGERLAHRMRGTRVPLRDGDAMGVTISVGVATIPESAEDLESLVDAADCALLRAKGAGKNRIGLGADHPPRHRRGRARRARCAAAGGRPKRNPGQRTVDLFARRQDPGLAPAITCAPQPRCRPLGAVRPRIMGILDDAIPRTPRSEAQARRPRRDLREIQDEAFGSTDQPN